jgi:large subunit ribosomal protein L9
MKIILKEKINNLGKLGDIVKVKPGYARNFLIPFGKSVAATKDNVKKFKIQKKTLERIEDNLIRNAELKSENILAHKYFIKVKSGENGRLFGSINNIDIARMIFSISSTKIEKNNIKIKDDAIRITGKFTILIKLHEKVTIDIILMVLS